ncbi:MAG: NifU family protein [Nitrospina sp.]|nr:NifU family protein [Nitrospina sp.]MBT3413740.1 NifU family protein [Nitrospina sp.]MBT3857038.1 NifU family protein [Nitrospina sp.]MBT4103613.1 NifU family protein [Nitrospina sp.]MBT4390939.1 NifU family protein [Nitrospina sp.]
MKISEVLAIQEKLKETSAPVKKSKPKAKPNSKKALKVVRTKETPNPNALQFVINAVLLDNGNISFASKKEAEGDKMATALFERPGVLSVFVMDNFVTVTKDDKTSWVPLKDRVWKTIDETVILYQAEGKVQLSEVDVINFIKLNDEKKLQGIEMVLNRSIRTNLAQDGGGVELKGIDGNEVQIHYQGACGSCPTSTSGTLQYIQTQLRQQLHPELTVKSV